VGDRENLLERRAAMLGFEDAEEMEGGLLEMRSRQPAQSRAIAVRVVGLATAIAAFLVLCSQSSSLESRWLDGAHRVSAIAVQTSESQRNFLNLDRESTSRDDNGDGHGSEGKGGDDDKPDQPDQPDENCSNEEFGQCAGRDGDGKSYIACCPEFFWCARFGDWWGMCLPSKVYRFPEHPEQQRPWRDNHGHDERDEHANNGHVSRGRDSLSR
jgi:hypothetical protein